ncbi:MAG: T9SS type A sorting domain-containing protein [Bacteroidia bacterium]
MSKFIFTLSLLLTSSLAFCQDFVDRGRTILPLSHSIDLRTVSTAPQSGLENIKLIIHPDKKGSPQQEAEYARQIAAKKQSVKDGSYFNTQSSSRSFGDPPRKVWSSYTTTPFGNNAWPQSGNVAASADPSSFVQAANHSVIEHFTPGTLTKLASLASILTPNTSTLSDYSYEPHLIFDDINQRYVLAFVSGLTPQTSELVICFSDTSDILGSWNVYVQKLENVPGLDAQLYTLSLALTKKDFFVLGQLSTPNPQALDQFLLQGALANGYAGTSLNYQRYDFPGATNSGFYRLVEDYTPGRSNNMYLIANRNFFTSSSTFSIFEIDKALEDGGSLQNSVSLSSNNTYSRPLPIPVKGASESLNNRSSYIQSAIRKGKSIYFANTTNNNSRSSIYLGTIQNSPLGWNFATITTQVISDDDVELAHPSLSFAGEAKNGTEDLFVFFNYSSPNHFPGTGVIYVYPDGKVSPPLLATESDAAPSFAYLAGDVYVWGFYTTTVPFGEFTGVGAGCSFDVNGRGETALTIFGVPGKYAVSNDANIPATTQAKAFPNPAQNHIALEFTAKMAGIYHAEVLNIQGQRVLSFPQNRLEAGLARLKLNTSSLKPGVYFAQIEGENNAPVSIRFVVQ